MLDFCRNSALSFLCNLPSNVFQGQFQHKLYRDESFDLCDLLFN